MKVQFTNKQTVGGVPILGTSSGGTVTVTTTGGELLADLANLLTGNDRRTQVQAFFRDGDVYRYKVTIHGYSLDEFEDFLRLLENGEIDEFLGQAMAFTSSSFPMRDND